EKKSESPTTSADATTGAGTASATAAPGGGTKVTIDGQDQNVSGTVVCAAMGANMNIAIGGAAAGIAAVIGSGDSPAVQSVGLGNVNGVTLAYQQGVGQGEAKAEKDGNTYTISGTATGVDLANPMQPVSKPFQIDVTCP
ncbi:MAG TPA: lipoprotein LpqH, partial [Mycobacterium sp.]|nr:lipoprotein LpqH [Mycobacterium sp.]